jgi:hypothetical protein
LTGCVSGSIEKLPEEPFHWGSFLLVFAKS